MPNLNAFYTWSITKCNENDIGYSQAYRNQQTVGGITYYDCSSFVNYALLAGGWSTPDYAPDNNAFTTYTQAGVLTSLGWSEVDSSGEYKPGDIGLSDGHTEICYQGGNGEGIFMGAHTDGVPLADQVSIANYTSNFPRLFRYGDGGAYGISIYVVAAICGNFWQESGINPGIWEGLSDAGWDSIGRGYGLGQWTNVGITQGRLYKLHEFLSSKGYDNEDGEGQIQFLIAEDYWTPQAEAASFDNLSAFLNSDSTDLAFLTHAYNIGWEGIHDDSWENRVVYAQMCYDYIEEHYDDESITGWIAGNRYLGIDERLNNAVMVYRALAGNVPPDQGGRGESRKGMPVYMMIRYF